MRMKKPKLLDLFCGAGGASMGYYRAGFEVEGVDIKPQPHYPFKFYQADALEFPLDGYDAYHASPPCQFSSTIAIMNRVLRPSKYNHPNLIPAMRERLEQTGKHYVIENVRAFTLVNPVKLTGSWFGLDIKRDRFFECTFAAFSTPSSKWQKPRFRSFDRRRRGKLSSVVGVHGHLNYPGESKLRQQVMTIDWMSDYELTQAIPPAYTEYIGKYLIEAIERGQAWLPR